MQLGATRALVSVSEARQMGYDIALYPAALLITLVIAMGHG